MVVINSFLLKWTEESAIEGGHYENKNRKTV